jgi:hypothetical protein
MRHTNLCFFRIQPEPETFIAKALINTIQSHREKSLICGTTGIAAVQYPGGTILHSLFRLGIDKQSREVSVQISDTVLRWPGISLPLI